MWALTADEMKQCRWLKPRLVTQIEFKEWTPDEIGRALSEEALTACVMQRYHVHLAVKRELGAKIGSTKQVMA